MCFSSWLQKNFYLNNVFKKYASYYYIVVYGKKIEDMTLEENIDALEKGIPNLLRHVSNIKNVYKLPSVVAVNRFPTDTDAEVQLVIDKCKELGVNVVLSNVWAEGGNGGVELAEEVVRLCEQPNDFSFSYELDGSIEDKIEAIVKRVYGGDGSFLAISRLEQGHLVSIKNFFGKFFCFFTVRSSMGFIPHMTYGR